MTLTTISQIELAQATIVAVRERFYNDTFFSAKEMWQAVTAIYFDYHSELSQMDSLIQEQWNEMLTDFSTRKAWLGATLATFQISIEAPAIRSIKPSYRNLVRNNAVLPTFQGALEACTEENNDPKWVICAERINEGGNVQLEELWLQAYLEEDAELLQKVEYKVDALEEALIDAEAEMFHEESESSLDLEGASVQYDDWLEKRINSRLNTWMSGNILHDLSHKDICVEVFEFFYNFSEDMEDITHVSKLDWNDFIDYLAKQANGTPVSSMLKGMKLTITEQPSTPDPIWDFA